MISVILLAAGSGKRMKLDKPKQFMMINNKPLISYALETFQKSKADEIVIVTNEDNVSLCKDIVNKYHFTKVKDVIVGGNERYDSVYNGLSAVNGRDDDIVLIHDSARANISLEVISSVVEEAGRSGAAIPAVPVKDTIKVVKDGVVVDTPLRSTLYQVQTPQGFKYNAIRSAYDKMHLSNDTSITDDSMVMEKYGDLKVKIVEGDYDNIKVTTPEDVSRITELLS
ncbi:MAG: 2-C-methyl-D-erythritol 4-phosphate cytidylyltransferase [Lachnospiraceae bacterium]|nr:2-C-methyl-D-erythritol 4-phosphate cytidylyltransferase [Lachnospiraceae bacterium]